VHIQRIISRASAEGSTVSSLICNRWLMLGLETFNIFSLLEPLITDDVLLYVLVGH